MQIAKDIISGLVMTAFLAVFGGAALYYADQSAVRVTSATLLIVDR